MNHSLRILCYFCVCLDGLVNWLVKFCNNLLLVPAKSTFSLIWFWIFNKFFISLSILPLDQMTTNILLNIHVNYKMLQNFNETSTNSRPNREICQICAESITANIFVANRINMALIIHTICIQFSNQNYRQQNIYKVVRRAVQW